MPLLAIQATAAAKKSVVSTSMNGSAPPEGRSATRWTKVANSPRVTKRSGLNVVGVVPVVMPFDDIHATASA